MFTTMKNSAQLIGNLGKDPEVTRLRNGGSVARVSIAVNEKYKTAAGERQERTDWFNLVMWGKTAELAESMLMKGDRVAVEGRLRNNNWTDAEGRKRRDIEIHVNEFIILSDRQRTANGGDNYQPPTAERPVANSDNAAAPTAEADDDLPF